jgi:hypothetical protein
MRQFVAGPALLVFACRLMSGDSVPDDIRILNAIFPQAHILLKQDLGLKSSSSTNPQSPDVFGGSPVYRVITAPHGKDELCAASDVVDQQRLSDERQVQIRVFSLPQSPDLVSVMQYRFVKANPPMSCPSLARVDYLQRTAGRFSDTGHVFLDSTHHSAIENLRLLDLDGDGKRELVVKSNSGGACQTESDLVVFSFTTGYIRRVLNVPSRFETCVPADSEYVQELDVPRTVRTHGTNFCFTKKTYVENGNRLEAPNISYPCYPRLADEPRPVTPNKAGSHRS